MARTTDRDRVLGLLAETSGLSNARIKNSLNLGDDRYDAVRDELIADGLAEKYVCHGGGLRLTKKGEREVSPEPEGESAFDREDAMYEPLIDALKRDAGEGSVIFETASLRKRGKWQNPDVTELRVDVFPRLRQRRTLVISYEAKPWGCWDISAVFEAASHARFAHEGYLVLEWIEKGFSLDDPRLDQVVRECRRFGIGLMTLEAYYSSHRVYIRLEAQRTVPKDNDVEVWLDHALSRRSEAEEDFNELMAATSKQLAYEQP
jgi:hypothetical protein